MERPWLLLRHRGCLWGVQRGQVSSISHPDGRYQVQVGCHLLEVDEVVSLVALCNIRRFGPVLTPLAPDGCTGLASSTLGPVVMIDAAAPPAVLRAPGPATGQPPDTVLTESTPTGRSSHAAQQHHPAHPNQI